MFMPTHKAILDSQSYLLKCVPSFVCETLYKHDMAHTRSDSAILSLPHVVWTQVLRPDVWF
jgi:hypothetical protein